MQSTTHSAYNKKLQILETQTNKTLVGKPRDKLHFGLVRLAIRIKRQIDKDIGT